MKENKISLKRTFLHVPIFYVPNKNISFHMALEYFSGQIGAGLQNKVVVASSEKCPVKRKGNAAREKFALPHIKLLMNYV